jgi:cytochrome c-type biogenesis protein CcmH
VLLVVALVALFALPVTVTAAEPMSPEALEIANELNCPVCEGQSVRDSNSQLARDMRAIVQERLDEGYTRQEVLDYFVDRYGVGILREPPKSGFFLTLWWAPVIGLAIGALVLGTFVAQRRRAPARAATPQPPGADHPAPEGDDDLSRYEAQVLRALEERSDRR